MRYRPLRPGTIGARADIPGIDPALVWADATQFRDYVREGDPAPAEFPIIQETLVGNASVFDTSSLNAKQLRAEIDRLRKGKLLRLELQLPIIPQRPRPASAPPKMQPGPRQVNRRCGGKVLIGVIDSGCPFANAKLRRDQGLGTHIWRIWDQDARDPAFGATGGTLPTGFNYGLEIARPQLEALMMRHKLDATGQHVDEAACYAAAMHWPMQTSFSHGAAVLSLLAGPVPLQNRVSPEPRTPPSWAAANDLASQADIVFVQLPRDAVQDSSSASLVRHVLDGLRYILSCASPATQRIVVNISDGSSRGTHDGESIIERAMRALVADHADKLRIVIPAGNSYDEERHAQFDLRNAAPMRVVLRVPPATETPSVITLRIPAQAGEVQVRLLPPDQAGIADNEGWVTRGNARGWHAPAQAKPSAGLVMAMPCKGIPAATGLIVIAPTQVDGPAKVAAPAGDWRIEVRSANATRARPVTVHAWVSRNQRNPGALPRSHQARFIDIDGLYDPDRHMREADDDVQTPGSVIRRDGTMNSLATGAPATGVVVAAGALLREREPSRYSSSGPASGSGLGVNQRMGPDLALPTDESRGLKGIRAGGNLSGANQRVTGTSFAAPQVARLLVSLGLTPLKGYFPGKDKRVGSGILPPP